MIITKNSNNLISKLRLDEQIVVYALALDRFVDQYEFYHVYLGSKKYLNLAKIPTIEEIYSFFKKIKQKSILLDKMKEDGIDPKRLEYYWDFIRSILVQIELFIFKKKLDFSSSIKDLLSVKIIHPFNLKKEFITLDNFVQHQGFLSIKDYKKEDCKNTIRFKNLSQIKRYVFSLLEEKIDILSRLDNKYKISFSEILSLSKLKILISSDISCYYKYLGNYRGEVGLSISDKYKVSFLKTFLFHECLPGHHLYYLIRQYFIDSNPNCDLLYYLDTYYSPENSINEGLAVCSNLVFKESVDQDCLIQVELEKFMHKFFYNGWYNLNIKKIDSFNEDKKFIVKEFEIDKKKLSNQCKYFFKNNKFYTPTYVLGIDCIEKIIPTISCSNYKKLYEQHSVVSKI